ncbi:MAG: hypothetical protein WCD53_17395 [Microcoleus sp.]
MLIFEGRRKKEEGRRSMWKCNNSNVFSAINHRQDACATIPIPNSQFPIPNSQFPIT